MTAVNGKRSRCSACHEFAFLALAACCACPGVAQQLPTARAVAPQRSVQQDGGPYRISGRVVDAQGGNPLARCVVEIVDVKHGFGARTVLTGEDGSFIFEGVSPSKYQLSASKHGFLTQSYEQHDIFSTAIAVGPGLISEDLAFKLTLGAILSGTVTDESGEPVRQAQVKLFRDQDADGIRSTRQQTTTNTDDRGAFEIANIGPGTYFLSASAQPWYARQVRGMTGSTPDDAALDVAYPTLFYPDVTDADAATPIPIKGGERLQADLIFHAEHAMHLRIPMTEAEMKRGWGVSVNRSVFGEPDNLPINISSDGSGAVIDGLLPGHYDVSVTKNDDGRQSEAHFFADVTGDSAQVSDEENKINVTVPGRVFSSEGKLPPGSGMALVALHSRNASFAPVNDAGEFTFSVPPGRYEVLGQINHHYLATVSATGASLVGRVLTVKAGATPRLEVLLGNSYGQIDGTVMHDGHPASAAMVFLVPDHPGENTILFRRDQSDSDGTFTLAGILPGHYRVIAIERGWELEWAKPSVLAPFLVKSKQVYVRGNDHLQGTIELQTR
jgi:protocatechuate 3,4-dioxygenase beta subunit